MRSLSGSDTCHWACVITFCCVSTSPLLVYGNDQPERQVVPSYWSYTGAVWVGGISDDNIYGVSEEPTEDQILRVTPAVGLNYLSRQFDIRASHQFDSDSYSENSDLDNYTARRDTTVDVEYMATRRLSLGMNASSAATDTPRDLVPEMGIERGRARAERDSAAVRQGYRWTPGVESNLLLEYVEQDVEGFTSGNSKLASFDVEFMVGPRGSTTVMLENFRQSFQGGFTEESNALFVGRSHQISRQSDIELIAGVRKIGDENVSEWSARFGHVYQSGEIRARYAKSYANVIGMTGLSDFEILEVSLDYLPTSRLRLSLVPAYVRTGRRAGIPVDMKRATAGLEFEFSQSTSLTFSYDWSKQTDRAPGEGDGDIDRNVVALGIRHYFLRNLSREQEER
jgi:hypothetical protein